MPAVRIYGRARRSLRKRQLQRRNPSHQSLPGVRTCKVSCKLLGGCRQKSGNDLKTETALAINRRAVSKYKAAHPDRRRAHNAARNAEKAGRYRSPGVCQIRGCTETKNLHRHHYRGYDEASVLAVVHCCGSCHRHLHSVGPLPLKKSAAETIGLKYARAPKAAAAKAA